MSDFNSAEFVVGTTKGIRVWRADSLGRLTGWTHRQVWTPGENVATCKRGERSSVAYAWMREYDTDVKEPEPCESITTDCGCGFWAYHSGTPDFGSDEGVVGICEGYGKTTIGTKGFRAEKARIVALAFPKSLCGCSHDQVFAQSEAVETLVRRNYPDVPVFDSVADMTAAFPPDQPESPTPVDPEFWTMADPAEAVGSSLFAFHRKAWATNPMAFGPMTFNTFAAPSSPYLSLDEGEPASDETEAEGKPARRKRWWF